MRIQEKKQQNYWQGCKMTNKSISRNYWKSPKILSMNIRKIHNFKIYLRRQVEWNHKHRAKLEKTNRSRLDAISKLFAIQGNR
jgi:hypothetical protein